ncbi:MAG: molybdopterin molybdotransferase MoeA [Deltaproteobacteria bacterium]|nr:molybdopterin molybdotransferase MoeA [Deltaproteobacteria bacterium]
MLALEEAQSRILQPLAALPGESVALAAAHGRVAVRDRVAACPLPQFDNSAMDGFAVRAADTATARPDLPVRLRLNGAVAAGRPSSTMLLPGEAMRIFTGGMLPMGADAVIPQEACRSTAAHVDLEAGVAVGADVRRAGEDIAVGERVLEGGQEIGAGDVALLAAQGIAVVEVVRRPRVAVLATGDELKEIDAALAPGEIRDCNSPMLAAAVADAGGIPIVLPPSPDREDALEQALFAAARAADLIVSAGGVSVGDHDLVREVIRRHGRIDFWQVAIKPGKPLAFGALLDTPFIGLPGNPVSAFVCFELFARLAVRRLGGHRKIHRPRRPVRLTQDLGAHRARRELVRATLETRDGELWATPRPHQGSSHLSSLAQVDALLDLPAGDLLLRTGDAADALILNPNALAS